MPMCAAPPQPEPLAAWTTVQVQRSHGCGSEQVETGRTEAILRAQKAGLGSSLNG